VDDHRSLVWDEFVGQWLALLPLLLLSSPWWTIVIGFALFRLFDVWKPWPIGWLDRHLKGGLGVMVDDAVAGGFAGVLLAVVVQALR
jgi:phosphatidylglycerophosphatase A